MKLTARDLVKGNWFLIPTWVEIPVQYQYSLPPEFDSSTGELKENRAFYKPKNGVERLHFTEYVEPIPLTPEILEECGFEITTHDDNGYLVHRKGNVKIAFKKIDNVFFYMERGGYFIKKLKHVHQLQNLFYDLTGKELEIKF